MIHIEYYKGDARTVDEYTFWKERDTNFGPKIEEITNIGSQELAELREELNKMAENQPGLKLEEDRDSNGETLIESLTPRI